jgi:release factor glutamine methyltransferase
MDVRSALRQATARLRAGGVPSHTLAAELLLMHVLGRDRAWLYTHPEEFVEASAAERYFDLVARRIAGVPTQYLTGKQEFWGLEFEVCPGVLIPRPETEHVMEAALERLGPAKSRRTLRGADVGTGSGCLAVALACELPEAGIVATDISPVALEVARRNAARHGVAARIEFVQCNLLDAFLGQPLATRLPRAESRGHSPLAFDLIVSNPPYVAHSEAATLPREVGEHEPAQALFGGEGGNDVYPPLVVQAEKLLAPGGVLVLELSYNAFAHVRALLAAADTWTRVAVTHDLAGIPRVLAAERV